MSNNYNKISLHNIYAIIEPRVDVVYVGKTTIENPNRKRSYVINGKISSVDGEFSENCKFLLLESTYISKPEAFRRVLAWYRFFENNGYKPLVSEQVAHMIEFPKKKTEDIYNEVCLPYSIKEVLGRKILPLKKAEEKEEPQTEQYPFTQLNIRVKENVADSFRTVSRKLKLSQNDTLKLLLSEKDDEMKISLANEVCNLKQQVHDYKELFKQQSKQSKEDKNHALRKHKEKIEILRNSINLLVKFLSDVPKEKIHMQRVKEQYGNKLFHSYLYPATPGCCLATLEEIVIGKYHTSILGNSNATKFLLFNTLNGEKIKLRLYGGNKFIGRYPTSYAYKSSHWIVGYTISNDGAANMLLGIPVDSIYTNLHEEENILSQQKHYSDLDYLISIAEDIKLNNY